MGKASNPLLWNAHLPLNIIEGKVRINARVGNLPRVIIFNSFLERCQRFRVKPNVKTILGQVRCMRCLDFVLSRPTFNFDATLSSNQALAVVDIKSRKRLAVYIYSAGISFISTVNFL